MVLVLIFPRSTWNHLGKHPFGNLMENVFCFWIPLSKSKLLVTLWSTWVAQAPFYPQGLSCNLTLRYGQLPIQVDDLAWFGYWSWLSIANCWIASVYHQTWCFFFSRNYEDLKSRGSVQNKKTMPVGSWFDFSLTFAEFPIPVTVIVRSTSTLLGTSNSMAANCEIPKDTKGYIGISHYVQLFFHIKS